MLTAGPDNSNANNIINGEGMYAPPQYTNVYVKQKEKPVYGKAELILSPLVFLFSFLFVRFVIAYVTGIISSLIFIALITTIVIYLKKKGYAFSGFNKALTFILYLFSFVYSVTANGTVKSLNTFFLCASLAYLIFSVCADRKEVERYLPYAMKRSLFEYPFSKFDAQPGIFSESLKSSETSSNIKKVILGLLLAAPVTIIVGALLMEADDGINRLFVNILDNIYADDMFEFIAHFTIALPLSLYFFGMVYRNAFRNNIRELTEEECEFNLMRKRTISNLILYTAAAPVLLLYVMFFISQASYFLSAFTGRLPEEFSYAEYARKGFFELCWIVVINLGIMIFMNLHAKNSGKEKTAILKAYNIIFCVFTVILIATVVSKMVMYIDAYGLTPLRVYTTWFMILCAFIFLIIFIKQFRPQMHMAKWISVIFTVMFAVLCFSRSESLIIKYNSSMGKVDSDSVESDIKDMSDDGVLAALDEGLISVGRAQELSRLNHYKHSTDDLNISTLILESRK